MPHDRKLLNTLLDQLKVEFPGSDLEWVVEKKLRGLRANRQPDIAAYRPDGQVFLLVEVGYTDPTKIRLYRKHGFELLRWYTKQLTVEHEERPGEHEGRITSRELRRREVELETAQQRLAALTQSDLWAGAPPFMKDIAHLTLSGMRLSHSPDLFGSVDSSLDGHHLLDLFPQGWASVSIKEECWECEEALDAALEATPDHREDDCELEECPACSIALDFGSTLYLFFDASGYACYFECDHAAEHSGMEGRHAEVVVPWGSDEAIFHREQMYLFARDEWWEVVSPLVLAAHGLNAQGEPIAPLGP